MTGVTAGHLIAVWVGQTNAGNNATTSSVSDGTTSFTAGTNEDDLFHSGQWHYLLSSVASGTVTYTATYNAARTERSIIVIEFAYTGTPFFDQQNVGVDASGTSAAPLSGTITTTGTDELVLGGEINGFGGRTVSSPLINSVAAGGSILTGNRIAAWWRILSATFSGGAASSTLSSASPWICNIISFKAVSAGAPPMGRRRVFFQ